MGLLSFCKIMKPLSRLFPIWLAIIITFTISGALHDLFVMIVKWRFTFFLRHGLP